MVPTGRDGQRIACLIGADMGKAAGGSGADIGPANSLMEKGHPAMNGHLHRPPSESRAATKGRGAEQRRAEQPRAKPAGKHFAQASGENPAPKSEARHGSFLQHFRSGYTRTS